MIRTGIVELLCQADNPCERIHCERMGSAGEGIIELGVTSDICVGGTDPGHARPQRGVLSDSDVVRSRKEKGLQVVGVKH